MDAIHIIMIDITGMIAAVGYLIAQLSKLGPPTIAFNKLLADHHTRTKQLTNDATKQTTTSTTSNIANRTGRQARAVSVFLMSLGMVSLLSSAFIPGPVSSPLIVLCAISVVSVVIGLFILMTEVLFHSILTLSSGILDSIRTIHSSILGGIGRLHSSVLDSNLRIAQMLVRQATPSMNQEEEKEERPTSGSS